jgi:hypothetical protein
MPVYGLDMTFRLFVLCSCYFLRKSEALLRVNGVSWRAGLCSSTTANSGPRRPIASCRFGPARSDPSLRRAASLLAARQPHFQQVDACTLWQDLVSADLGSDP